MYGNGTVDSNKALEILRQEVLEWREYFGAVSEEQEGQYRHLTPKETFERLDQYIRRLKQSLEEMEQELISMREERAQIDRLLKELGGLL